MRHQQIYAIDRSCCAFYGEIISANDGWLCTVDQKKPSEGMRIVNKTQELKTIQVQIDLLLKADPAALSTGSKRYGSKQCLKLPISLRPFHSHACNSLLPVPQRLRTVEATIKRANGPVPISTACPKPTDRWRRAIYRWLS